MALGTLPPWMRGPDVLGTMEAGGRLGLAAHQSDVDAALRRAELAQHASEAAAAQGLRENALNFRNQAMQEHENAVQAAESLKRDQLGLATDRISQTQEQNSAVDSLRKAQLDETAKHNNELFDLRKQQLDKPTSSDNVSLTSGSDSTGKTEIKLSKDEYAAYLKAHKAWQDSMPSETVPGRIWGTNPNPARADYATKNPEPQPTDFIAPAANALTPPTASDSAPAAPDIVTGGSVASPMGTSGYVPLNMDNAPTATNPKTGEKLILKDGKWQPLPPQ